MKLSTFKGLIFSVVLTVPFISFAADVAEQPSSDINNGAEVFDISCPGMPQETTIDIDACYGKKLAKLNWVKDKYLTAVTNRLKAESKDDAAYSQKMQAAFQQESAAWDNLVEKAVAASHASSEGGTGAGASTVSRKIELVELQIHDVWNTWLRYEDSTPPVLPEPKFTTDQ